MNRVVDSIFIRDSHSNVGMYFLWKTQNSPHVVSTMEFVSWAPPDRHLRRWRMIAAAHHSQTHLSPQVRAWTWAMTTNGWSDDNDDISDEELSFAFSFAFDKASTIANKLNQPIEHQGIQWRRKHGLKIVELSSDDGLTFFRWCTARRFEEQTKMKVCRRMTNPICLFDDNG